LLKVQKKWKHYNVTNVNINLKKINNNNSGLVLNKMLYNIFSKKRYTLIVFYIYFYNISFLNNHKNFNKLYKINMYNLSKNLKFFKNDILYHNEFFFINNIHYNKNMSYIFNTFNLFNKNFLLNTSEKINKFNYFFFFYKKYNKNWLILLNFKEIKKNISDIFKKYLDIFISKNNFIQNFKYYTNIDNIILNLVNIINKIKYILIIIKNIINIDMYINKFFNKFEVIGRTYYFFVYFVIAPTAAYDDKFNKILNFYYHLERIYNYAYFVITSHFDLFPIKYSEDKLLYESEIREKMKLYRIYTSLILNGFYFLDSFFTKEDVDNIERRAIGEENTWYHLSAIRESTDRLSKRNRNKNITYYVWKPGKDTNYFEFIQHTKQSSFWKNTLFLKDETKFSLEIEEMEESEYMEEDFYELGWYASDILNYTSSSDEEKAEHSYNKYKIENQFYYNLQFYQFYLNKIIKNLNNFFKKKNIKFNINNKIKLFYFIDIFNIYKNKNSKFLYDYQKTINKLFKYSNENINIFQQLSFINSYDSLNINLSNVDIKNNLNLKKANILTKWKNSTFLVTDVWTNFFKMYFSDLKSENYNFFEKYKSYYFVHWFNNLDLMSDFRYGFWEVAVEFPRYFLPWLGFLDLFIQDMEHIIFPEYEETLKNFFNISIFSNIFRFDIFSKDEKIKKKKWNIKIITEFSDQLYNFEFNLDIFFFKLKKNKILYNLLKKKYIINNSLKFSKYYILQNYKITNNILYENNYNTFYDKHNYFEYLDLLKIIPNDTLFKRIVNHKVWLLSIKHMITEELANNINIQIMRKLFKPIYHFFKNRFQTSYKIPKISSNKNLLYIFFNKLKVIILKLKKILNLIFFLNFKITFNLLKSLFLDLIKINKEKYINMLINILYFNYDFINTNIKLIKIFKNKIKHFCNKKINILKILLLKLFQFLIKNIFLFMIKFSWKLLVFIIKFFIEIDLNQTIMNIKAINRYTLKKNLPKKFNIFIGILWKYIIKFKKFINFLYLYINISIKNFYSSKLYYFYLIKHYLNIYFNSNKMLKEIIEKNNKYENSYKKIKKNIIKKKIALFVFKLYWFLKNLLLLLFIYFNNIFSFFFIKKINFIIYKLNNFIFITQDIYYKYFFYNVIKIISLYIDYIFIYFFRKKIYLNNFKYLILICKINLKIKYNQYFKYGYNNYIKMKEKIINNLFFFLKKKNKNIIYNFNKKYWLNLNNNLLKEIKEDLTLNYKAKYSFFDKISSKFIWTNLWLFNIPYTSTIRTSINTLEYNFYSAYNYYMVDKLKIKKEYFINNRRLEFLLIYNLNIIKNKELIIFKNIIKKWWNINTNYFE